MVPLIELRGAIPFSQVWGLSLVPSYIICIVGNMIPVPFVYWFARSFLEWGKDKKWIGPACGFFLINGAKAGERLETKAGKGLFVALMLFVGVPLPGTGAWTGTLAASLLGMKFKETSLAVSLGVFMAGLIMMLASLGFLGVAGSFFS